MTLLNKLWKLVKTPHTARVKQAPETNQVPEKQYPYEVRPPYPGENMDDFFGGPPRDTWDPQGARQRVIRVDPVAGMQTIRIDTRDLRRQYDKLMEQTGGKMPQP